MKPLNQPDPRAVAELDGEDERKVSINQSNEIYNVLQCPLAPGVPLLNNLGLPRWPARALPQPDVDLPRVRPVPTSQVP